MVICEMSGCEQDVTEVGFGVSIYAGELGRFLSICDDCHEEYQNAMAYGHPDMAYQWLTETQKELTEKNPFDTTGGI